MDSEAVSFRGAERDVVSAQLVVKMDADQKRDSASVLERILGTDAFTVIHAADARGMCLIELTGAATMNLEQAANAIEADPAVLFVEPNDRTEQCAVAPPDDPLVDLQWNLQRIDALAAWQHGHGPGRVLVAVADSGIPMSGTDLSHEDLDKERTFLVGSDFTGTGALARDDNGHGTHVLGIAAAQRNEHGVVGLAYSGTTLSLKVFNAAAGGNTFWAYQAAIEAIGVAASRKVKLIFNYSGQGRSPSRVWTETATALSDADALLVCATGNDAGPVGYPAALSPQFDNVVAVGATDSNDDLARFSNRGPEVNVVAPGVDIVSTLPNYAVGGGVPLNYGPLSGTSMATPLVSALAAIVWSNYQFYTAARVRRRLEATAVDLGTPGRDNFFGFGRVNARAALDDPPLELGEPMPKQFWPNPPHPPPHRSVFLNTVPGMGVLVADASWFIKIGNTTDAGSRLGMAKDALVRGGALLHSAALDRAIASPSAATADAADADLRRQTDLVSLYKAPWIGVRGLYEVGFHLRFAKWLAQRSNDRPELLARLDLVKEAMADARLYGTLYIEYDDFRDAVETAADASALVPLIDAFTKETNDAMFWMSGVIRPDD